jgi:hypothetical protein
MTHYYLCVIFIKHFLVGMTLQRPKVLMTASSRSDRHCRVITDQRNLESFREF